MDIFDWFDDPAFDLIAHIIYSKIDAETRVSRALPSLQARAQRLLEANRGTERAYPEDFLNQSA